MRYYLTLLIFFLLNCTLASAQNGWSRCNVPFVYNRIDDVFMVNNQTGFAACGDGQILKSTDGGNNWFSIFQDSMIYCRSVEFINANKGFVGGFPSQTTTTNILRETTDGGATWTDLTPLLDPRASKGICGLCAADSTTIYGCGNWYQDSAYIVKSSDAGSTWNFIDMHTYAGSLIDMYFLNKDTGFATGCTPLPVRTAAVFYTTDGGASWSTKFQNTINDEYCWKIQRVTNLIYFASIEDLTSTNPEVIKSVDGGMTWNKQIVSPSIFGYDIEGIGFIDSLHGWTGGNFNYTFETKDGGMTWDTINNICPIMNRVFKVNDSLLIACGYEIWKYTPSTTGLPAFTKSYVPGAVMKASPNPAKEDVKITLTISKQTHVLLLLFDEHGKELLTVDNSDKGKGEYQYLLPVKNYQEGSYMLVLKTHEDKESIKIMVQH